MQQAREERVMQDTDRNDLPGQEPENLEKLSLQSKKLQKLRKAYENRGIIYVSRIPPHMVYSKCFGTALWSHFVF